MPRLRIGTSGWSYEHWRDRFYPADLSQEQWLEFYASRFDTVEINASFYHIPPASAFLAWKKRAPSGFLFAIKAPRQITHWRRLINSKAPLLEFLERARLLEDKLGPILFQCPPRWSIDLYALDGFLAMLPEGLTYAFEFRDRSWLREPVFERLRQANVGLCRSSSPHLPDVEVETAPFIYLRMHGDISLYESCYSEEALTLWTKRIRDWRKRNLPVYVYFNNDANAFAVQNASTLIHLLKS